jgi:peroxiredoxin (alkyl hydroperoxide reductase subunit C)
MKPAPNFKTWALMPNSTFKEISLTDYRGKYVLLFFYPFDFTFVCPTEIIAFSDAMPEFEKLNVQILACSVDSHFTHFAWTSVERKEGGIKGIQFPILADVKHTITESYGILSDEGSALRGVFLINKDGIVIHQTVNAPPIGRNIDEELRTVKALQFYEKRGEVCPANWQEGQNGIDVNNKGVYFSKKYE